MFKGWPSAQSSSTRRNVKLRPDEKESRKCTACRDLKPNLRYGVLTGAHFTQLKHIYEKAANGCRHCNLIRMSLEAVDPVHVQPARAVSGSHTSVDTKIICEYLSEGDQSLKFEFVHPDYKLSVELYGVAGESNPRKFGLVKLHRAPQNPVECVKPALYWINDCISNHSVCSNGSLSPLPKRILDISNSGLPNDKVFLRESLHTIAHYACLSYCWGTFRTIITTKDNRRQHMSGILVENLPQTFRDAINFAKELGLQYIWIDSLCILQDDELDWREEAAKMASYYSQAYVTLAATASDSADGGLFREQVDAKLNDGDQVWLARAMRHLQRASITTAPLFQRCWIFQERLLSPRVLHFTEYELLYECSEETTCECKQDMPGEAWRMKQEFMATTVESHPTSSTAPLQQMWHRIVEDYSKLHLTKSSDIFPALSGLVEQIRGRRGSRYFAGLWEDTFLEDMLWFVYVGSVSELLPKLTPWRAPSWSWASVANRLVRYNRAGVQLHEQFCKVLDTKCDGIGPSISGELRSASVVLRGPTFEGVLQNMRWVVIDCAGSKQTLTGSFAADYQVPSGEFPVLVLRVGKNDEGLGCDYQLVLKPTNATESEYMRVGLNQSSDRLTSVWGKVDWTRAKERTLTVV